MQSKPMDFHPHKSNTGNAIDRERERKRNLWNQKEAIRVFVCDGGRKEIGNLCVLCCYLRIGIGGTKRMRKQQPNCLLLIP